MNKKIVMYYTILLVILGLQVVTTVVQASQVVSHGKKVAQVETQIQDLTQEKNRLVSAIAKESSLLSVSTSQNLHSFVEIASPLILTNNTTVAYSGTNSL